MRTLRTMARRGQPGARNHREDVSRGPGSRGPDRHLVRRSAGTAVVEQLLAAGITHAFTVPGESFLAVLDAMHDPARQGRLRVVATRHESGAAFMAAAFGRLVHRPAVCLATRAVGAANLSIGIHTARQDSAPMVALVGQVERRWRGREAFQEVDLVNSFGRLAKWAVEIDRAEDIPRVIHQAVAVSSAGRPGPVLVALPEDVLAEPVETGTVPPASTPPAPADPAAVRDVVRLLDEAERPAIVAGGGVLRAGAVAELVRLAELLEVPVFAAWRRPDAFPNDHRLYLGMTGLAAPPLVRDRMMAADVLVAVGTRLSEIASFEYRVPSPGTRFAHVDVEPFTPSWRPGLGIAADARAFLAAATALAHAAEAGTAGRGARRAAANVADRAAWEEATTLPPIPHTALASHGAVGCVHPGAAVRALARLLPPDAILTSDAGNFAGWPARHYRFRYPGTFLGPTSGAMGYALPAAIAAALARPGRAVVAMAGDGGFAMVMSELETAVREGVHVTSLVFDNAMYGTIRMHQELAWPGRVVATDLGPVDFAGIARAMGASAFTVRTNEEVEPALREALSRPGASVVHLLTDPGVLSVDHDRNPPRLGAADQPA